MMAINNARAGFIEIAQLVDSCAGVDGVLERGAVKSFRAARTRGAISFQCDAEIAVLEIDDLLDQFPARHHVKRFRQQGRIVEI